MPQSNQDPPIIPFDGSDGDTGKIGPQIASHKIVYDIYYEWIQADNKWIKLILTDPDPVDIPPGKYDGQIIAIKR